MALPGVCNSCSTNHYGSARCHSFVCCITSQCSPIPINKVACLTIPDHCQSAARYWIGSILGCDILPPHVHGLSAHVCRSFKHFWPKVDHNIICDIFPARYSPGRTSSELHTPFGWQNGTRDRWRWNHCAHPGHHLRLGAIETERPMVRCDKRNVCHWFGVRAATGRCVLGEGFMGESPLLYLDIELRFSDSRISAGYSGSIFPLLALDW